MKELPDMKDVLAEIKASANEDMQFVSMRGTELSLIALLLAVNKNLLRIAEALEKRNTMENAVLWHEGNVRMKELARKHKGE